MFDGTGRPGYRADIAIVAGRIQEVGTLSRARARTEVDAAGRYVVPGFIDTHVHGDALVGDPAVQLAVLRQGVTTVVLGQDGLSFAPATSAALSWVSRYFCAVNGAWTTPRAPKIGQAQEFSAGPEFRGSPSARRPRPPALSFEVMRTGPARSCDSVRTKPPGRGLSVAELLSGYHATTAVNTVYLVPHGTVRYSVMGGSPKPPDAQQLAAMVRLVEEGIEQGAAGVSSGLGYLPGRFAPVHELAAVCRPAARHGMPYVTHMRGYGEVAGVGMTEACAIGRKAGVPVHISHYHGPGPQLVELIEAALAAEVDITYDTYPYLRGCSILAGMLPGWLSSADLDATLAMLGERAVRQRLAAEICPSLWGRLTLAHVPGAEYRWAAGMRLVKAAQQVGVAPAEFCADLLIDTALCAGVIFDFPDTEDSLRELLRHDAHMGGSDGIYVGARPHPRGYGTFARLLRRHVRELHDWTWEQAVEHLSTRPARRFRLTDRGTIARGQAADLAVIDPTTVRDHATYARPRVLATGIDDVIVAGIPVLANGQLTGQLPGTSLRPHQERL
ncbi:amidohydrolase family protein [Nocardia sp. JMUB6875]|uniref:N-acyl-D-amino-acid deacylase family protein n=1 Tax=Nocardia sp. JMUB6875 TaxID=3158170 RepID=UPI0032E6EC27